MTGTLTSPELIPPFHLQMISDKWLLFEEKKIVFAFLKKSALRVLKN